MRIPDENSREESRGGLSGRIPKEDSGEGFPRRILIPKEDSRGRFPRKIPEEDSRGKFPRRIIDFVLWTKEIDLSSQQRF